MTRVENGMSMYKLILIDYNMPACNGAEVTSMIKTFLAMKHTVG